MSDQATGDLPRRCDATRNRRAIVEAARRSFGQRGLDAPFDEIARRAGVGNATLYRHFPSRCALVAAVFADTLGEVVDAAATALESADAWAGFADYVRFLCRLQATDCGFADLLTTTIAGAPELEELRARAYADFVGIVGRAKATGELRADFEPEDLLLLMMANAGLIHRTTTDAPAASDRLVSYTLDGLRSCPSDTAPPSPGAQAVQRAMEEQAVLFGCT